MVAMLLVGGPGLGFSVADPLRTPESAAALDQLKQGNRHLDLEHYDKAIEHYEAGALIEPVPMFWLNIGLAHRRAGRYAEAARAYRTFLRKVADDPAAADLRVQVEEIVRSMDEAASRPPTEPAPALGVEVDSIHAPERRPVSRFTATRKLSLAVGGLGVIALGTGGAFALRSRTLEREANDLCPMTSCADAQRANDLLRDADANGKRAGVALGVGAATVVGAAVLWLVGAPGGGGYSVAASVSPEFAGFEVSTRF